LLTYGNLGGNLKRKYPSGGKPLGKLKKKALKRAKGEYNARK
jgi:hypothetical protein